MFAGLSTSIPATIGQRGCHGTRRKKLDQSDLIAKLRAFFYALRHGQMEWVLATLTLGLPVAAAYLRQELNHFHWAGDLAYALSAASGLWLIYRVWKRAAPPPDLPAGPLSSAIKGLSPFTAADGRLFAQLGRHIELQQLLGLARNDLVATSAVRGESGAGKTSLLQAGLAYSLGQEQCVYCVYWEAVPEKAPEVLLHAIRSQLPGIESLESLPEACPKRCVLILDQFEQLRAGEPAHAPVFALLDRIAKAPAPHKLSALVGFRREYTADWLDLEKDYSFRAEQVPINLLAPRTAADALVTLASEVGFSLDQALVENFISGVASPQGVSPVDIAIAVLSLANFVQQRGTTHIGMKEYDLAGGAEGLLLSFVQQKLEEEVPEAMRAPLLKGIVLALVNASNNQRIAAGESAAVIASKAEAPETALTPWLDRLAHPRVRLLEKLGADRYRLPHERLVPVLRRLAGGALAALDQLRLLFEGEYVHWRETRNRRHLLAGKDLRNVLRRHDQFVEGETAAGKTEYLTACLRRRAIVRFVVSVVVIAAAVTGYAGYRVWDSSFQQQKLANWRLPRELFKIQDAVDQINLHSHVNDLTWLRSAHVKNLGLVFDGFNLIGLEKLKGLTSLSLNLSDSQIKSLAGLEQLKGLTSLQLFARDSQIKSLAGLEQLKGLTSLSLDLSRTEVKSLAELEKLKGLTSLSLDLFGTQITSLAGLEQLKGLTSLSLDLRGTQITSLAELENPGNCQVPPLAELGPLKGLTSLSLNLSDCRVANLAGLEQLNGLNGLTSLSLDLSMFPGSKLAGLERLKGLTSLSLDLDSSYVRSLAGLEQLKGLTSLSLDLRNSKIARLAELEQLNGLTSLSLKLGLYGSTDPPLAEVAQFKMLTSLSVDKGGFISLGGLEHFKGLTKLSLDLRYFHGTSLEGLEDQLKGLTSLSLDLGGTKITSLAGLEQLKGLTSLSLDLRGTQITSLAELEKLKGLTSLSLDLDSSYVRSLAGLEKLKGLTSIEITLPASLVSEFSRLKIRRDITQLHVVIDASTPLNVPTGYKFVGLIDR